jgi:hypothetical protein
MIPRNLHGQEFDFYRWRAWRECKAEELRSEGYDARFRVSDSTSKPASNLSVGSKALAGSFTNWITGETNFEVMDCDSGVLFAQIGASF